MSREPADAAAEPSAQPVLRIINADATPEEIAVIVAILAAAGSGPAPAPKRRSQWASYQRGMVPMGHHGPGAWKASGLPR